MPVERSIMRMQWIVALFLPWVALAAPHGGALGAFDGHADIGKPKLAGYATWNAASQEYVLTAGGVNMWGARDEFHMAWRKLDGDFILQARVEFLGKGVDPHRKAGLIVRSSLDEDSPYVDGALHAGDGLTSLQFRRGKGALTEQLEAAVKGADVVQLERRGDTYIFSAARFGEPLSLAKSPT
jgi:TolB protein